MAPELEILDTECFLIRHCLTVEEQIALFEYIDACDVTPPEGTTTRRAMVPAPTTLVLGKNDRGEPQRVLHYAQGDDSMVTGIVRKASEILKEQNLHVFGENNSSRNVFDHHALTMAVIRYEAPDGKFPPHVDHCNDSLVFLTSLGLTANFLVRGPTTTDATTTTHFKFGSGDLLVFNASTEAALLHGVVGIDAVGSGEGALLGEKFPVLQKHRYGVQCRMTF